MRWPFLYEKAQSNKLLCANLPEKREERYMDLWQYPYIVPSGRGWEDQLKGEDERADHHGYVNISAKLIYENNLKYVFLL